MNQIRKSVIIIGAGLGGLATAIRLAARGVRVRVLEKNALPGGKVNLHRAAGYSFDTGASLLTMRHVVDDLFRSAGREPESYLELVALDPICRYTWPDGTTLDASTDIARTEREIERIAGRVEVVAFRRFLSDARAKYEVAERTFLAKSLNELPELLRPRYLRDLFRISSLRTLDAHVRAYFRSPYLRQLFDRFATYNGSSPYRTPAAFALIPYVEFGLGAWYVRGGMYALPAALARVAAELGVEIACGAEVARIMIETGRARGVLMVDGTELRSDAVVANSDAVETYRSLIGPAARRGSTARRLDRLEPSSSGFVLLLGVARRYPRLAHHNIYFSSDYEAEFRSIFEAKRPASDPTIYVCASTVTDPGQAPEGHENLFVLVNAPATSSRIRWATEAGGYRDLIVERLENRGVEGLARAIDYEHIITPEDFESIYRANRGSIYGPSSNRRTGAFLRPPNKARDVEGLYFAGGSSHPGGGIPLVLLSGKMTSELLLREW